MLALAACRREAATGTASPQPDMQAQAAVLVARINRDYPALQADTSAAQWLSSTDINPDSERLAAAANARWLATLDDWRRQARRFDGKPLQAPTALALQRLRTLDATPAPQDARQRTELAALSARLQGLYGTGRACHADDTGQPDPRQCRDLRQLAQVLAGERDYAAQLQAWQDWHDLFAPMKRDYARMVELANVGARDNGFHDLGARWRSAQDPASSAEMQRLWEQVKPLYAQLHCYARTRLRKEYGDRGALPGGLLPAHLLGDMWAQDWSNAWDLLAPAGHDNALDVTTNLQRQYQADLEQQTRDVDDDDIDGQFAAERAAKLDIARQMTRRAEDFYVSLGLPQLPDGYWQRSRFLRPLERDVQCHASAWDMDFAGDVRTKMCIEPNEAALDTVYHELGHVYYYLSYVKQPALFQSGASDALHEAVGDTIVLALTPDYLRKAGLLDPPADPPTPKQQQAELIDAQLRMALMKVAPLPFDLLLDRWRWGVFDGSIPPSDYNAAWWKLRADYQGIAPALPRGGEFFDAGAKYHVAANMEYARYFLAGILQFQLYKALCDASGYRGELAACSFYGNADAGKKLRALLEAGGSAPWPQILQQATGSERIDASALLEYFAPLHAWLETQNQGQSCGWTSDAIQASAPPAKAASANAEAHAPGTASATAQ